MKILGYKEVDKAAKLYKKKQKIEKKIEELSKQYFDAVSIKTYDFNYFIKGVESHIRQQNRKK